MKPWICRRRLYPRKHMLPALHALACMRPIQQGAITDVRARLQRQPVYGTHWKEETNRIVQHLTCYTRTESADPALQAALRSLCSRNHPQPTRDRAAVLAYSALPTT